MKWQKFRLLSALHTKSLLLLVAASFSLTAFDGAQTAGAASLTLHHPATVIIERLQLKDKITFCAEPVPVENPDVRERLEREFLISLDNTDSIILWLKRANRYFPHIEKVFKAHGLPDDLKYIAIAESALLTHAASGKGAVGYWQFIESTGAKYGLTINSHIDERRNIFTATEAAARYLKELYTLFGSWTLAAAAYNMGEDGLRGEMLVQKVNDYYKLHLYPETQRYIFRILAAKIIMSNPSRFGYILAKEDLYEARRFEVISVDAQEAVPLQIIAEAANTYFKEIRDLNPQLRSYFLPPGRHDVSVPYGSSAGFTDRYDNLVRQWAAQKEQNAYTVKRGDTLTAIASRFNVPLRAIYLWNNLANGGKISPGDRLYIYPQAASPDAPSETLIEAPY